MPARWYYTRPVTALNHQRIAYVVQLRFTRIATQPIIVPRPKHAVSRADISDSAVKVLYRLHKAGYQAFLVGGGVRDLLLGLKPKDFDVATDAHPEEIKKLFRNARLIGRRFRLAHVRFGREIIEVATFRALHASDPGDDRHTEDGRILRDNVYGTLEEDAWRRDFTINGLYYNIADFSLVDYVGGLDDLKNRQIRLIGDPETRYREDPVRVLRAIRFAAKLGLDLEPATEHGISEFAPLLADIPPARLFEEILKLFQAGAGEKALDLTLRHGVFAHLFPETAQSLENQPEPGGTLLRQALINTDARVARDEPITPGFLFAALLWPPVKLLVDEYLDNGVHEAEAYEQAASEVIARQVRRIAIPKRFSYMSRDIWLLQRRLAQRGPKRAIRLAENPRFPAAQDFLSLRAEAGEPIEELATWWRDFRAANPTDRDAALNALPRKSRRRRRRPRKNVA